MSGPTDFAAELLAMVQDVLHGENTDATVRSIARSGGAAVAVRPTRDSACPVELWVDPDREQIGLLIGEDAVPYERVFLDLRSDRNSWQSALSHLRELLTAIVRGHYRQERIRRRDGTAILTRGFFQLADGEREHVARSSLSFGRRRKRERVSFDAY